MKALFHLVSMLLSLLYGPQPSEILLPELTHSKLNSVVLSPLTLWVLSKGKGERQETICQIQASSWSCSSIFSITVWSPGTPNMHLFLGCIVILDELISNYFT